MVEPAHTGASTYIIALMARSMALSKKIEAIEQQLWKLDIDNIIKDVNEVINTKIRIVSEKIESSNNEIASLRSDIHSLREFKFKITDMNDYDALKSKVDNIQALQRSESKKLDSIIKKQDYNELKKDVADIRHTSMKKSDLNMLFNESKKIKSDVDLLRAGIGTNTSEISKINNSHSNIRSEIDVIKNTVANIPRNQYQEDIVRINDSLTRLTTLLNNTMIKTDNDRSSNHKTINDLRGELMLKLQGIMIEVEELSYTHAQIETFYKATNKKLIEIDTKLNTNIESKIEKYMSEKVDKAIENYMKSQKETMKTEIQKDITIDTSDAIHDKLSVMNTQLTKVGTKTDRVAEALARRGIPY